MSPANFYYLSSFKCWKAFLQHVRIVSIGDGSVVSLERVSNIWKKINVYGRRMTHIDSSISPNKVCQLYLLTHKTAEKEKCLFYYLIYSGCLETFWQPIRIISIGDGTGLLLRHVFKIFKESNFQVKWWTLFACSIANEIYITKKFHRSLICICLICWKGDVLPAIFYVSTF